MSLGVREDSGRPDPSISMSATGGALTINGNLQTSAWPLIIGSLQVQRPRTKDLLEIEQRRERIGDFCNDHAGIGYGGTVGST